MTGGTISHYELISEFWSDGAGSVHRARDIPREKTVILRIVSEGTLQSDDAKRRLIQDVVAVSKIDHPNIASVSGVEEVGGRLVVVFDTGEGQWLRDRVGKLSASEVSEILRQILEGLNVLADGGIVCGTVSSRDVFLANDGTVKLTAFGLGRLLEGFSLPEADPELLAYCAPEILLGGDADGRSDLWSLGVLLFEMFTGETPFGGGDVPSLVFRILNFEPRAASLDDPGGIPVGMEQLGLCLLTKDPLERAGSVAEVIELLEPPRRTVPGLSAASPLSVTYFSYAGPNRERTHVAVGLTEDVMWRLSQLRGLTVRSRDDVIPFGGGEFDVGELGRCMGVEAVLRGSVWELGERWRVTVRLTDVESRRDLWRETFEGPGADTFDRSTAIAVGVVEALGIVPTPAERLRLTARLTEDPRAHEFHARGRECLTRRGRKSTDAAVRLFQYALLADPGFALAHASLAEACGEMFTYYDGAQAWLDRMGGAAARALELDPGLVEARFHVAMALMHREEYGRARTIFEQIVGVRPMSYEAHRWLGIMSDVEGDYDAAIEYYRKTAGIKPCSVEPWLYINMTHRRRGDLAAATGAAKKFLEVGLKTLQIVPDDPLTLSRFCVIYTLFGEKEKAYDTLDRILRTGTEDGRVLYNCAATFALMGDEGRSLDCLRRALDGGYKNVRGWINGDPDFDGVRHTVAFQSLLSEYDVKFGK